MLASRCFFSGVRHVRRRWCDHHRLLRPGYLGAHLHTGAHLHSWGVARCVAARSEALPAKRETGHSTPDSCSCHRSCNPSGQTQPALAAARPNAADCRSGPNQHLGLRRRLDCHSAGSFAAVHRMLPRTGLVHQTVSTRKHQIPELLVLFLPRRFRHYP